MQMRNGSNNKYMNLGSFHSYLDKNIFESATFFSPDTASFLKYPVNRAYESATFLMRSPEWKCLNTL